MLLRKLAGNQPRKAARRFHGALLQAPPRTTCPLQFSASQANPSTGRDRLRLAVPAIGTLFERLAARGDSLRAHTARLLGLLDDYGPRELAVAVARALERDALGADAIAHLLDTQRRLRRQTPPIPLALPDRPGVRDLDVTPHSLESYDDLARSDPDDPE